MPTHGGHDEYFCEALSLKDFELPFTALRAAENHARTNFFRLEVVQALDVFRGNTVLVCDFSETVSATYPVELSFADFFLEGCFSFLELICIECDGNIPESPFFEIIDRFGIDIDTVVAHFKVQVCAE